MAVMDVVSGHSSVANTASLTVQPGAGVEWVISNIYGGGKIEVYMTNGSNPVLVNSVSESPYSFALYKYFLNNTYYMTIKNVSGGSIYIGYNGIITK